MQRTASRARDISDEAQTAAGCATPRGNASARRQKRDVRTDANSGTTPTAEPASPVQQSKLPRAEGAGCDAAQDTPAAKLLDAVVEWLRRDPDVASADVVTPDGYAVFEREYYPAWAKLAADDTDVLQQPRKFELRDDVVAISTRDRYAGPTKQKSYRAPWPLEQFIVRHVRHTPSKSVVDAATHTFAFDAATPVPVIVPPGGRLPDSRGVDVLEASRKNVEAPRRVPRLRAARWRCSARVTSCASR